MKENIWAVLRVRARVLEATREWLVREGYIEVQGPILIPYTGEEMADSFEVKYFDRRAYLAQGLQPYAEALMVGLGKIFTIAPTFRAEKTKTSRHLTEYWRIEAQAPRCDLQGIMRVQEELITHICHTLSEEALKELGEIGRNVKDLQRIQTPFPKMTYDEAVEALQRDGFDIQWGREISWKLEEHLGLRFNQPFFLTHFPMGIHTFLQKSHPERPELTLSMDLMAPEGYGEIASGGQMIDDTKELEERMKEAKIEPESHCWYMDLRKHSFVPHSGFVMGLERILAWICKLKHIKDATAFPRLITSLYP